MKLIYAKGACSLAVHILLEELGTAYETLEVSLTDKTELKKYNPKGYVPALVLDDGQVLTEATNILQYIVEIGNSSIYLAPPGTLQRARCIEWLVFVSTEFHKAMGPLFHPDQLSPDYKNIILKKIEGRLEYLDKHLAKNKFLLGETFTIADMYAIAILRMGDHLKLRLDKFAYVMQFKSMMEEIPSVKRAIMAEETPYKNIKREENIHSENPMEQL
ncbi:MAG: glutathione S-transferase N-terminal domain-containing protein [Bacteriovorax sp.]|nr:glutathione S-transferase N-terminal domain-containing protein [Bacteriovorax sp.]